MMSKVEVERRRQRLSGGEVDVAQGESRLKRRFAYRGWK